MRMSSGSRVSSRGSRQGRKDFFVHSKLHPRRHRRTSSALVEANGSSKLKHHARS
jgi:hypothetical protein